MVTTGWALQAMRQYPDIWERPYKTKFQDDLRVYIEDDSGLTGPADAPRATWETKAAKLEIYSTRSTLWIKGHATGDALAIKIYAHPDAADTSATVKLGRDKSSSMSKNANQPLIGTVQIIPSESAGFDFIVQLPYTMAKGQFPWANGIEHARLSIGLNEADRRNLYLASPEEQVRGWLLRELTGGLRTWQAIYNEKGFIPSGIGTGRQMDAYSDTGGYAHLITAAAQWLLYLDNKSDWQQHHFRATK
jgi:hypothetical protein